MPWPIRLKILDNESLTSWFMRTAFALGIDPHTLRTIVLGKKRDVLFDYDVALFDDQIAKLSFLSGIPKAKLHKAALRGREGTGFIEWGRDKQIWLTNHYRDKPRRRTASICPQCLYLDPIPHLRKDWRLSFITVCKRHRTRLLDHCPHCKTPFFCDSTSLYDKITTGCPTCGLSYHDMIVRCDEQYMYSNKFLADINSKKLSKWRAYKKLRLIIGNLFGVNTHRQSYWVKKHIEAIAPDKADRILSILSKTRRIQGFGQNEISYRHEVLRVAFTIYGPKIQFLSDNQILLHRPRHFTL